MLVAVAECGFGSSRYAQLTPGEAKRWADLHAASPDGADHPLTVTKGRVHGHEAWLIRQGTPDIGWACTYLWASRDRRGEALHHESEDAC